MLNVHAINNYNKTALFNVCDWIVPKMGSSDFQRAVVWVRYNIRYGAGNMPGYAAASSVKCQLGWRDQGDQFLNKTSQTSPFSAEVMGSIWGIGGSISESWVWLRNFRRGPHFPSMLAFHYIFSGIICILLSHRRFTHVLLIPICCWMGKIHRTGRPDEFWVAQCCATNGRIISLNLLHNWNLAWNTRKTRLWNFSTWCSLM